MQLDLQGTHGQPRDGPGLARRQARAEGLAIALRRLGASARRGPSSSGACRGPDSTSIGGHDHERVAGRFGRRQRRATPCSWRRPATWRITPRRRASPRFRSELGLEAKLISVDNTQVYVATDDDSIVVAFRGSEAPTTLDGLKDWLLTNANNYLILPTGRAGTDFAAAGVGRAVPSGVPRCPGDDLGAAPGGRRGGAEGQGAAALDHRPQPRRCGWPCWPPGGSSAASWRCRRS